MDPEASRKALAELSLSADFISALVEASEVVIKGTDDKRVRVVSHFDADGISSAALISQGLERLGMRPHVSLLKGIRPERMAKIANEDYHLIIFADMGSSALEELSAVINEHPVKKIIILDHHQVQVPEEKLPQGLYHLNCRDHDIDGGKDASAATMSFLLMYTIDPEKNLDLVEHMICGIVGDKQDRNGLTNLNKAIVDKAMAKEMVQTKAIPALWGDNIAKALDSAYAPLILDMVSGDEPPQELLKELSIPEGATFEDLNNNQLRFLTSTLAIKLLRQGVRPEVVKRLTRTSFFNTKGEDLVRMSKLVDSCGRENEMSTGLMALNGDEKSLARSKDLYNNFTTNVRSAFMDIYKDGVSETSNFYYFYCKEEQATIAGTLAELVMDYLVPKQRPVISLTPMAEKDEYQVSARGTNDLVEHDMDLAKAMKEAAEYCQGSGGGHPIAAGASIPHHRSAEFMKKLEEVFSEQNFVRGGFL